VRAVESARVFEKKLMDFEKIITLWACLVRGFVNFVVILFPPTVLTTIIAPLFRIIVPVSK
jgi:hypothetical protein